MALKFRGATYAIPWNIFLITLGCFVFALGVKPIALTHGFLSGGVSGVGLLLYYLAGGLSPGSWYLLLNVPIFVLGWFFISRRFMLYTLYGMAVLSLAMDLVSFRFHIGNDMMAAITAGALMGAGSGIIMRSLGSAGGTDIISIFLNQRYNMSIGRFTFAFNMVLFTTALAFRDTDTVLFSMALSYVQSQVVDYFMGLFNERKAVLIVSDRSEDIAQAVLDRIHRGSTFLHGQGAYTRKDKKIVLTVVNNYQLKRLEEEVFGIDPEAFFIVENTFSVLGKGFSRRKVY